MWRIIWVWNATISSNPCWSEAREFLGNSTGKPAVSFGLQAVPLSVRPWGNIDSCQQVLTISHMTRVLSFPGTPQHQALLRAIVAFYEHDPRVLAVIVFGSQGRGGWDA